jgi:predicted nucleotidyltransferase
MRISNENIIYIKETFLSHFQNAKIYLFGSRIDDSKKGGDIDLLIRSEIKYDFTSIALFRIDLYRKLGDRKIDIVNYTFEDDSPFLSLILEDAVEL